MTGSKISCFCCLPFALIRDRWFLKVLIILSKVYNNKIHRFDMEDGNFNLKEIEEKWMRFWEKNKIFKFEINSKKPVYSVDTPPPTVSGKMHLGHAFSYAQQDFIVRFKRMNGFNVFYPFGTDDNGLATIRLIEKEKNVKGFDMGREEFIKLVLDTLEKELRPKYIEDWKKIGMSCEWDIFYTTINEHCQRISQKSFIEMYKKGREYRKKTPFFWCPECRTSIAQVELKDKTQKSKFVYIRFDSDNGEKIIIATTRPEMMAACVGIYVHPDDKRYRKFIGHKAKIPFYNREIEIKANKDVAMDFGSGAVYHCTFGDMDDVEWVEKEKIKPVEIVNQDGTLNEKAGRYQGMKTKDAREVIIKDLEKENRIEKIEIIEHVVNCHERCESDVEILMIEQWFIRYLDLKKQMLEWGRKLNWYPAYMKIRYDNWVKGLKWDWSISRQRFYGIPIPVWYCKKCSEVILPEEKQLPINPLKDKPLNKCKCGSSEFIPEKDVLDTWATSSLTPQIAIELMPKNIQNKLFPMSLRPQAHDIITFWLFNTIVKNQLHYGKNPWKDVVISGFVLDPHRKKMSKSKGNVIEPQEVIEKYSADALRYWAASSKLGEDLSYQEKDILTGKKFITKILNSARFVFMNLKEYKPKITILTEVDRLFLLRLNETIKKCTESFNSYEYSKSKLESENFFWRVFCDNYLEIVKNRVYNGTKKEKESAFYTLYISLLTILKLLAPITPFITEEIYQNYYKRNEKDKSIHTSNWPKELKIKKGKNEKKDKEVFELMLDIIYKVRQEKSNAKKSMKSEITLTIEKKDIEKLKDVLQDLKSVTNASEVKEGKFRVEFV